MGHYFDLRFNAPLNAIGQEVIPVVLEQGLPAAAHRFTEWPFLEAAARVPPHEAFPGGKIEGEVWVVDRRDAPIKGTGDPTERILLTLLAFCCDAPVVVHMHHELGSPKELVSRPHRIDPDWDRRFGDTLGPQVVRFLNL